MTMTGEQPWSEFWQGETDEASVASRRASTAFASLWREWSTELFEQQSAPVILDAACGAGSVSREVIAAAQQADPVIVSVDIAYSALKKLEDAPVLRATADAAALPFAEGSFDAIASQYGVEYAGQEALEALPALLAPHGRIRVLAHITDGAVAQECSDNLTVLHSLRERELIQRVSELFQALRGLRPDLESCDAAFRQVAQACGREVQTRACPASTYAQRLFQDCATVLQRNQAYDPKDMQLWFEGQAQSIEAYAARMSAMLSAALDRSQIEMVLQAWERHGMADCTVKPVYAAADDSPAAWRLDAVRRS
ncbi:methyltransferase domain-containing protein [Oceanicaulis sp.]|uniref:methyltransferase domain-containing protein n=1 Tax=Oceanicaulis sp. TaxID=1924941 RepID=UPI003D2CF34B